MGCFVRGGKNGMGCFVRGDKNCMGCFVRGGKLMRDVLSGVAKNGMGCFVPGCFVLHSSFPDQIKIILVEIQSNLGYPNPDYPKLMDYSKTMDSPEFFLYYLLQ